ncbi:MAG: YgaP family membrane protein [Longimicrobiales bacterium]
MKKNEGKADRWLRMIFGGVLLLYAAGPASGLVAVVVAAAGIVALGTGFFGWCPAYSLLGVSTCPTEY